jgi:hypothetical protein
VQRGMHSASLTHVTLSFQETRVIHVHTVVDEYLDGTR